MLVWRLAWSESPCQVILRTSQRAICHNTHWKWLSGFSLSSLTCLNILFPTSFHVFSLSPPPPSCFLSSLSTYPLICSFLFRLPVLPSVFNLRCPSISDPWRKVDDFKHQEKWCWHVCVRWNQHGWRKRQWSCWTSGIWWVVFTGIVL